MELLLLIILNLVTEKLTAKRHTEHIKSQILTGLKTVTKYDHVNNIFNTQFSLSGKMDTSTLADITQLSYFPKTM